MEVWETVSKFLGVKPVVSATIGGAMPMRAERYFFQTKERQIPALPAMALLCHLGGGRASEGRRHNSGFDFIPSHSAAMPAHCPTEWMFGGAIDVAVFYFLDETVTHAARLRHLIDAERNLHPFIDPLVSALAQQIVDELSRAPQTDQDFVERLSALMVEQTCRAIEGTTGRRIRPDATQLGRLEAVLEWAQKNLTAELSCAELAERAGVSESHFRRVFQDAMGTSPHRFILRLRLERVRELLTRTDLSIARISAECGFNSQSHMTACFNAAYGVTPARVKQEAKVAKFSE